MPSLTLRDVLLYELTDLFDAEEQLLSVLPRWIDAARSRKLKEALRQEQERARLRRDRLRDASAAMGIDVRRNDCAAIRRLIDDVARTLREQEQRRHDATVRTALLRCEHYAIAGYGAAATFASMMGSSAAADLLQRNFAEEEKRKNVLSY